MNMGQMKGVPKSPQNIQSEREAVKQGLEEMSVVGFDDLNRFEAIRDYTRLKETLSREVTEYLSTATGKIVGVIENGKDQFSKRSVQSFVPLNGIEELSEYDKHNRIPFGSIREIDGVIVYSPEETIVRDYDLLRLFDNSSYNGATMDVFLGDKLLLRESHYDGDETDDIADFNTYIFPYLLKEVKEALVRLEKKGIVDASLKDSYEPKNGVVKQDLAFY